MKHSPDKHYSAEILPPAIWCEICKTPESLDLGFRMQDLEKKVEDLRLEVLSGKPRPTDKSLADVLMSVVMLCYSQGVAPEMVVDNRVEELQHRLETTGSLWRKE